MGLNRQNRRDLGRAFLDAYLQASGDEEGRVLVPFYTAYRAAVRGKVEGRKLSRDEMTDADRTTAEVKSRGSWLLALDELESPHKRPCLLLVTGLPGMGKSTLARTLAERTDMQVIRSDVVRKKLAGIEGEKPGPSTFGEGIYTDEWNRRTDEECLHQAQQLFFQGKRVIDTGGSREDAMSQAMETLRQMAVA